MDIGDYEKEKARREKMRLLEWIEEYERTEKEKKRAEDRTLRKYKADKEKFNEVGRDR